MILRLFTNWRFFLFVGTLALVVIGGFLPQIGPLLMASWWFEHQSKQTSNWQIVRRTVRAPQWWPHVHQGYRWARVGLGLGICLYLLWHLLTQPVPAWAWLCLLSVSYATGREILCVLSDWIKIEPVSSPVTEATESEIEVTIDLEPILADLSDLPLASENSTTQSREELTAQIESIRAECVQPPVG